LGIKNCKLSEEGVLNPQNPVDFDPLEGVNGNEYFLFYPKYLFNYFLNSG
jgi:hypothetical protein